MLDARNSQLFQTLSIALLIVLALLVAYESWLSRPWTWIVVLACLLAFFIVLGLWIMRLPLGILINERNLMSLSRLQIVTWSALIFSAYIVFVMQRIGRVPNPLAVTVDNHLWAILGISTASFVGTPLILNTKVDQSPTPEAVNKASNALKESTVDIQQNAKGTLYSNPDPKDARFSDIFQGDEVGNTASVDVSKVQMFLITVILFGIYASDIWTALAKPVTDLGALPSPDENMLKLFALSHAGYLSFKAVGHTDSTSK